MQDFKDCMERKRFIQQMVFSDFMPINKRLVGLGGPNLPEYLKLAKTYKFKSAQIWESDANVYQQQLIQEKNGLFCIPCELKYGDIINAEITDYDIVDVDICKSFNFIKPHINKFEYGIFTFSRRGSGTLKDSVGSFLEERDARIVLLMKTNPFETISRYVIRSDSGNYTAYSYSNKIVNSSRNGTQMVVIHKNPEINLVSY